LGRLTCCTALSAVAASACGGDDLRPDVRYQIIGLLPVASGTCPAPGNAPPVVAGATRARLTFRDQAQRTLRCDTIIPLDGDPPFVSVPGREQPVTMYVEYFDDAGTLLARGERTGVSLTGGATVQVYVQPTDAYACPLAAPATARAFHSATPLPNGEVLLLGGLIGEASGDSAAFAPTAGAYVSSAAEIYDPDEHRFYPLTIAGLLPRAFHNVLVLGMEGEAIELLVVGGIGVAGDPAAAGNIAARPTGANGAAPWTTVAADLAMGRSGTIPLPPEILLYDPATRSVSRTELMNGPTPRAFGTATQPGGLPGEALAVVGGTNGAGAAVLAHESVNPADGTSAGAVTGHPRIGATVTATSPTEALVWGGDVTALAADVRAGDRLAMLGGAPTLAPGPAATEALDRSFHAAARFGDRVAVVGGLATTAGTINDVGFAPFVHLVDPGTLTASLLDVPGATPAAYPAAVTLASGDIMFSGGAATAGCTSTLTCPDAQSFRVRRGTSGGAGPTPEATGAPGLARYGHRMTLLPDGTVLVSGGFAPATDANTIRALRDAELFAPHGAADDPIADLALGRMAGDVARTTGGEPLAPCTLVGGTEAPADGVDAAASAAD
jgi:hypothetical protein